MSGTQTTQRIAVTLAATAMFLGACASGPAVRSLDLTGNINGSLNDDHRIAGYYALPRAFFPVTLKRTKDGETVELGEAQYRADVSQYYLIDYLTDDFSDDKITVESDGNGLLKQVAPTSTDATANIIKKGFELGGLFATAIKPLHEGPMKPAPKGCGPKDSKRLVDRIVMIDPATWTKADADQLASETCFTVTAKGSVTPPGLSSASTPDARKCQKGICYRPALPFEVSVESREQQRQYLVMAPTPTVTLAATLDRRAITGLNTTLTFSNGMLTKFESTDPNQASALLQIPIDVLSTVLHGEK